MSKKDVAPEGFTRSSGNVFADLQRQHPEVSKIKANLALKLNQLIDQLDLSQSEMAQHLGLQQPHISQLRNYKLKGFSVERLMELIVKMGISVEIQVGAFVCSHPCLTVVEEVPTHSVVVSNYISRSHEDLILWAPVVEHFHAGSYVRLSSPEPQLETLRIGHDKSQWTLQ